VLEIPRAALLSPESPHSVGDAVDATLIGRHSGRDHAASIARALTFSAVGEH
jgi:hypothetical protein